MASLQRKAKVIEKRTQITKTYQEGYESLKVTPLEMMQQELTQTTAENQLAEEYTNIDRKIIELETFAHYLFPVMAQLIDMEEMDCEMKNITPYPTRPE
ncbi:hypothetical protein [Runella sp.]|uniref:hypothetical protein n=1 Tax=Runella sp. TaxID=1960881 RepID=UPI003D13CAEA